MELTRDGIFTLFEQLARIEMKLDGLGLVTYGRGWIEIANTIKDDAERVVDEAKRA